MRVLRAGRWGWCLTASVIVGLTGCSSSDAAVAGDEAGAAASEGDGGGNGNGGGSASGPSGGDGGAAATDAAPTIDASTPVGTCDAACTGTKMCNDTGACVCAPGWIPTGKDCVVEPTTAVATRTKAEVCARYKAAANPKVSLWTPPPAGAAACAPGTVSYAAEVAALQYLDFYRWMLGIGPVQVLPAAAQAEQECAKILNATFSHSPPVTAPCYTALGAQGCGASLIAGGYSLASQFDGYGLETEQNLVHRRNILGVGRGGIWAGASGGSAAMHYGGGYPALPTDPAYVVHPGPGLNVRGLVPSRWFVQAGTSTLAPVDAHVFKVSTGVQMPMTRYHHYDNFSSFDVTGWTPEADVAYRVDLVDDTSKVVYSYTTTLVDCL